MSTFLFVEIEIASAVHSLPFVPDDTRSPYNITMTRELYKSLEALY